MERSLREAYPVSHRLSYLYDALNRLTNMVDGVGTTSFGYFPGGELETETQPWANSTVTYGYNGARLRQSLTLQQPTGSWSQSYGYDAADRLSVLTSPAGSFTNGYFGAGSLVANLGLPNTARITNQFDNVARMTNTVLMNSNGTGLDSRGYSVNAAGQRRSEVRTDGSYVDYTYDPRGPGQVVSGVGSGGQSLENLGYLYDAAANLIDWRNQGSVTAFGVNNLNELTSANGQSCAYGGNGNLSSAYGYLSYSYDDENELIQVTDGVYHSFQTQFVYDGLQRLRRRLEYTRNSGYQAWQLASETRYLFDGRRVIQERDGNNHPLVGYTRGNDLSGSLEGACGIGGLLARSSGYSGGSWGTHDEYHGDAGGNITALVGSSQSLVAAYAYDPFGNLGYHTGTQWSANSYRFSSKEWMANSGLYYYGYRLYDPNLQRWATRDPLGERADRNLYRFEFNDPLDRIDPFGLDVAGVPGVPMYTLPAVPKLPPVQFPAPPLPPGPNLPPPCVPYPDCLKNRPPDPVMACVNRCLNSCGASYGLALAGIGAGAGGSMPSPIGKAWGDNPWTNLPSLATHACKRLGCPIGPGLRTIGDKLNPWATGAEVGGLSYFLGLNASCLTNCMIDSHSF